MNDQVITLDKNDTILQVHSKIEWSDGRRIILIVPRGAKALEAEHELKLLRRWADDSDVQVANRRKHRLSHAAGAVRVGFHLYNTEDDLDRLLDVLR